MKLPCAGVSSLPWRPRTGILHKARAACDLFILHCCKRDPWGHPAWGEASGAASCPEGHALLTPTPRPGLSPRGTCPGSLEGPGSLPCPVWSWQHLWTRWHALTHSVPWNLGVGPGSRPRPATGGTSLGERVTTDSIQSQPDHKQAAAQHWPLWARETGMGAV